MKRIIYLLTVLFGLLFISLTTGQREMIESTSDNIFVNDLNQSIIDGFYGGDTTGIGKNIYLIR